MLYKGLAKQKEQSMKKAIFSLLAVGLLTLTACDTTPGADTTPSISEEPNDSTGTSSSEDPSPEPEPEPSPEPEPDPVDVNQLRSAIWTQLGYAAYTGNYTVRSGDGDNAFVEYLAVDNGYYYIAGLGGYKLQANVAGEGDILYVFTSDEDEGFVIQSPLVGDDGAFVTDLDATVNYLKFINEGTVTADILQIEDTTIFTEDQTFISSFFNTNAEIVSRVELDYTDYVLTLTPVLTEESGIDGADLALEISDITETHVAGLDEDLTIGPEAIDSDLFADFVNPYGSISFQAIEVGYQTQQQSLYAQGTLNYGASSYSSEVYQTGYGYFGENYYDDGNGLMIDYIDAATGSVETNTNYSSLTWDTLNIEKPTLSSEAFRFDSDLSTEEYQVYDYWGVDADDWVYDLVMFNLGLPVSAVYAVVEDGQVHLEAITGLYYYNTNPQQYFYMVFYITADELTDDRIPDLVAQTNDFDSTYINGKLDGTNEHAVQLTGYNQTWGNMFSFTDYSTITATDRILDISNPLYLADQLGYYLRDDGIYTYSVTTTEEGASEMSVQLASSNTALWQPLVADTLFPFDGNALKQDIQDSTLWWAAANTAGFGYYLYAAGIDLMNAYSSYGFAVQDSSLCFVVDEDTDTLLGFTYDTYYQDTYSFPANFSYAYDSEGDTSIEDGTAELITAIEAAIAELEEAEPGE